jgi:hypothetical protein
MMLLLFDGLVRSKFITYQGFAANGWLDLWFKDRTLDGTSLTESPCNYGGMAIWSHE